MDLNKKTGMGQYIYAIVQSIPQLTDLSAWLPGTI